MHPMRHLDVVCYFEDGVFVAHCLQLDLVATAETDKLAFDYIKDVIKTQIRYAVANNNFDHLFRPAPKGIWNMLGTAEPQGEEALNIFDDATQSHEFPSIHIPKSHLTYQLQTLCA
jgi:uncharacterized membrane protein